MSESYKSFSYQEYLLHVAKLQKEMKEANIDVLLLSTPENIYYSTGYRSWYTSSLFRPVYVLVPPSGDPAIILRILEKTTVQFTSWTPRIYCSGTATRNLGQLDAVDSTDAIHKYLNDFVPGAKTIGIEAGIGQQHFWSLNLLKEIIDSLPHITFVDGSLPIQRARMVKTPWEVEKLRTVGQVTERAILETGQTIIAGVTTEKDISKGIAMRMSANGVDKISYLTVTSGPDKYRTFNTYATDRIVQKGDFILVDISGHIDGYASDLTRVFYLGTTPNLEREMAFLASESVKAGKNAMKPGKKVSEINRICEEEIRKTKFKDFLVHTSGHGIGLNVVEHPVLQDNEDTELKPGMVFAVEQGVYPFDIEKGVESMYLSFRMEDMVLITEDGAQWLTGPGDPVIEIHN